MTDEPAAISRRHAIQRTALAAGLVWTAPMITSVQRFAVSGTPPPTSTSSSTPTATHYRFSGSFSMPFELDVPVEGCPGGTADSVYTVELVDVGGATVTQHWCLGPPQFPLAVNGTLTIATPDGTVAATFAGTGVPDATGCQIDLDSDVTIVGGTGRFIGATGIGESNSRYVLSTAAIDGTVDGSFDVPG